MNLPQNVSDNLIGSGLTVPWIVILIIGAMIILGIIGFLRCGGEE